MKILAIKHFFQQEHWPNGTVFVMFSKSSGGTMFSGLFSDFDDPLFGRKCAILNQNFEENHTYANFLNRQKVKERLQILHSIASLYTGFFLIRQELWSLCTIFFAKVQFWYTVPTIYWIRTCWECWWLHSVAEKTCSWVEIADFLSWLITSCHFISFLVFIHFFRHRSYFGKEIHVNHEKWKTFTRLYITPYYFRTYTKRCFVWSSDWVI